MYSWIEKEVDHLIKKTKGRNNITFEIGYGPSGPPHVGTISEAIRTNAVRLLFQKKTGAVTKLICFSDDMDALKKIHHSYNVSSQYLGVPLSSIPDPIGSCNSYADTMNNKLCDLLKMFDIQHDFISATHCYKSGIFNEYLRKVLFNYDKIMSIILPTLSKERQNTYSLFLPICPQTKKILQVKVVSIDTTKCKITYIDKDQILRTTSILDGNCKLQWKIDFAMRWAVFRVDYEIFGKDIAANADIYDKIVNILGHDIPQHMSYELFLDHDGKKISKSVQESFSIDQWMQYGDCDSIRHLVYHAPQRAKNSHLA